MLRSDVGNEARVRAHQEADIDAEPVANGTLVSFLPHLRTVSEAQLPRSSKLRHSHSFEYGPIEGFFENMSLWNKVCWESVGSKEQTVDAEVNC